MKTTETPFDIEKLTAEEVHALSDEIGIKVRKMVDNAADKINTLLKKYNLSAKLEVIIDESYKLERPKKARSRRKQS